MRQPFHHKMTFVFIISIVFQGLLLMTAAESYVATSKVFFSEAFFIPIEREWFDKAFSYDDDVEFSASLLDMPDLPNWMFTRHPNMSRDAFMYGAAEELGTLSIEIIALSKNNYKTAQKVMKLNIEPRENLAKFEVEMKFSNLNVEDAFKSERLERLLELFRLTLWKNSGTLYITKVVSALDVGGRLPLNPKEKEGVVVRIGGSTEFSRMLLDLEREVQPLRNRFPCPRDYKRTSVEHIFRRRNFIADWCSFHLITNEKEIGIDSSREMSNPSYSSISLLSDDFQPQSINAPRRDFLFDFIISIVVPSAIVGILSIALTCIMCCSHDTLENKFSKDENFQLNQYDSIHYQSNVNENGTIDRNSLPRSSVPQSARDSPNSMLHKTFNTRPSSRTGTLRGNMLPPPPPYTPSSIGSKRNTPIPML